MHHLMLDLETYGKGPGCTILAIGACFFSPRSGEIGDKFYRAIDKEQSQWGLKDHPDTVAWWEKQSDEAKKVFTDSNRRILPAALEDFGMFAMEGCEKKDLRIWGNGADFDNAILAYAYGACEMTVPWEFWNGRCYRTIKNLGHRAPIKRLGTYHNALDDAVSQAEHLLEIVSSSMLTLA